MFNEILLLAIMVSGTAGEAAGACAADLDCSSGELCRTWIPRWCDSAPNDDLSCWKISASASRWDGTSACVAEGTDDTTCNAINGGSLPKFSSVSNKCVGAPGDDATCAAISASASRWDGTSTACVAEGTDDTTCNAIDSGSFPYFSSKFGKCVACKLNVGGCNGGDVCSENRNIFATSTCVNSGADDNSCFTIDEMLPRWDGTACVAEGTSDAECLALSSSLPKISEFPRRYGNPSLNPSLLNFCRAAPTDDDTCQEGYNPSCLQNSPNCERTGTSSAVAPIWDATTSTCVVVTNDDDCEAVTNNDLLSLPKFSSITHTCVAAGSDDASCRAISRATPYWDVSSAACISPSAKTTSATPSFRVATSQAYPNQNVPAGTNDASCEEISNHKPRFSIVSNDCVVVGHDDATCADIDAAKPKWSGNACRQVINKLDCTQAVTAGDRYEQSFSLFFFLFFY